MFCFADLSAVEADDEDLRRKLLVDYTQLAVGSDDIDGDEFEIAGSGGMCLLCVA